MSEWTSEDEAESLGQAAAMLRAAAADIEAGRDLSGASIMCRLASATIDTAVHLRTLGLVRDLEERWPLKDREGAAADGVTLPEDPA